MTFYAALERAWHKQDSLVCVGLDPDLDRIPEAVRHHSLPYYEFCRRIVDATAPFCAAYKPQAAHFGAFGREGELAQLIQYIKNHYPDHIVILDAKRGDIGSTAEFYAKEAYERYGADAVTVNPYLGWDSIEPYTAYPERGVVVLCRTSNPSGDWIQNTGHDPVFETVARTVSEWNTKGQFMLVAGATYPAELAHIRSIVDRLPFLVPGIGAQGGDLAAVVEAGLDSQQTGLLISSSRGIIFSYEESGEEETHFAEAAAEAASTLNKSINNLRNQN